MRLRLAVATRSGGLEDRVSEVFAGARTFTIVEVEDGRIRGTEVIENPAVSFEHGRGPIVAKKLVEEGVNVAIAGEFGPGALAILKAEDIRPVRVRAGTSVRQAVKDAIKEQMRGRSR